MDKSKYEESKLTVQSNEDQELKALDCQMCQKTFARIGDLNTHMKHIHNQRKSYKCESCKNLPKNYYLSKRLQPIWYEQMPGANHWS